MVESAFHSGVSPDDLFSTRDLKQFYLVTTTVVARNDGVSVRKPLGSAGIVEQVFSDVFVVHAPDDLSLSIDFDDAIAVGAADQGVAISQSNRRKWPVAFFSTSVVGREGPHDFTSLWFVFFDGEVEQVRRDIVAVREDSQHSRLHVCVSGLALQRSGQNHFSLAIDHEGSWLRAQFSDQEAVV